MESKKKLIRKMAMAAAFILVIATTGVGLTSIVASGARAERREEKRFQRAQAVDEARGYLEELAGQIGAVPVDPTIVGEIQARYFEEIPQGHRFVWGMGTDGAFLFGVPREDFARLNTIWDAHETGILAEGAFVDRQDFLRQLVQQSDRLDPSELAPNPGQPDDTAWFDLRRYHGDRGDWMVFSAPVRADDGSALGDIYLKMEDLGGRWEPWTDSTAEKLYVVSVVASVLSGLFLWFLLPTWVYVDARERGVRRAMLWSFLVLISVFVGLVVYLIARPEQTTLKCPSCERDVNGGAFCPHCGHDLSTAFCTTCRYPLTPEWAFCPSCRTEIPRPASGVEETGETQASTEGS